jgi:hypothetical protein
MARQTYRFVISGVTAQQAQSRDGGEKTLLIVEKQFAQGGNSPDCGRKFQRPGAAAGVMVYLSVLFSIR